MFCLCGVDMLDDLCFLFKLSFRFVMYNSDWIDKSRFFMATIRTQNELHWMQSFEIDPEKQKYETVRIPESTIFDISSIGWKNDSQTPKRFLVYMDEQALYFTILQENDVIFDEKIIFLDLEQKGAMQFYFELYAKGKILLSTFFF
jgi:hypothetical protein